MTRPDHLFVAAALALAAFAAGEARGVHVTDVLHARTGAIVVDSRAGSLAPAWLVDADDDERRGSRGADDIQARIRMSAAGTYIDELLLQRDSSLTRWRDRRATPLRVWVQNARWLAGFDSSNVDIVQQSFTDWQETGIPVPFAFVRDSSAADVHVTWTDRFHEPISGKTLWSHDAKGWILEGNIQLALHHHGGEPLDGSAIRAISLHEVGHLIGLDHTTDVANIMTPRVRVRSLSDADKATARLLYSLPPGNVR